MHGIPYGPEEPTSYFVGYKCPYEYNLYSFIITLFLAVIVSYAWFVRRSHPCGAIHLLFFYPEWTMTATRRYNFKSKHIGYTLWHHKKNHEWNMQLSFPITKFIQKREDRQKKNTLHPESNRHGHDMYYMISNTHNSFACLFEKYELQFLQDDIVLMLILSVGGI